MSKSLTSPLLSYLLAGARLTGVKHGYTVGNDSRILTFPDGTRRVYGVGLAGHPGDVDALERYWSSNPSGPLRRVPVGHIAPLLGDLLEAWQPDRKSSRSRQFYIETGTYLPAHETADDDATRCANCDAVIEPDDGGAIWYHRESREMPCDPEGEQSRDRMAEPA